MSLGSNTNTTPGAPGPRRQEKRQDKRLNLKIICWHLGALAMGFTSLSCQVSEPPKPSITTVAAARGVADEYCHEHQLDWGEATFVMPQNGGYYVEYGDAKVHHGLSVNSDGSIEP
jgi:hypothetical protein